MRASRTLETALAIATHLFVTISPTTFPLALLYAPRVRNAQGLDAPSDLTAFVVAIVYGLVGLPLCLVQTYKLIDALHEAGQRGLSACEVVTGWGAFGVWLVAYVVLWIASAQGNEPVAWGAWSFYVYVYGLHRGLVGPFPEVEEQTLESTPERALPVPRAPRAVWVQVDGPTGVQGLVRVDLFSR
jgi:hypothetical protein